MLTEQKQNSNKNIYELPDIKSKYSISIVSKVITITFGIIVFLILAALLIITTVKIDVTIDAGGYLEPSGLAYIHSPLSGEIKNIFVKSGSNFRRGDLLVQFDSVKVADQLEKSVDDLAKKRIEYEIKERSLPIEFDQIELNRKKAEAQLLKAKANLRQKANDYFPGSQVDSLIKNYKQGTHITMDYAIAEIISAEAELDNYKSREQSTRLKELELQSIKLELKQLEKLIERQKEYLTKTKFFAPFDGKLLTENLENMIGAIVNEGSSLFEISETNSWKSVLNVSEKDVYELSIGDSVKIEVKAMKLADEFFLIPGKITNIAAEPSKEKISQVANGLYRVDVAVNIHDYEKSFDKLRRGFTIEAKIIQDSDKIINVLIKNIRKWL